MSTGSDDRGRSGMDSAGAEYRVLVTNEQTGAEHDVLVHANGPVDAQTDAVHWMFAQHHWRYCTASAPRRAHIDG